MENWITRIVATLCATGSSGFFWMLGVFVAVPWREGRMLALERIEPVSYTHLDVYKRQINALASYRG